MFFGGFAGPKSAEVLALARLWIFLLRVKSVFTRLELSNHSSYSTVTDFARFLG